MSNEAPKEENPGFKVEDRRRFSETGDVRPEYRDASSTSPEPTAHDSAAAASESAEAARQTPPPLELNFSTFVISLSTQALAHLGEIPNPIDMQTMVDLGAAKQLIDILGILKDKTKGNLDKPEADMLDRLLYDLRLRYVERVRGESERA